MRAFKASLVYFAIVFGIGFVLGAIRVSMVVPRLGVRWAELLEMPLMLLASFFAARFVVRRFGPFSSAQRLIVGIAALAFLVAAELGLTVAIQDQTIAEFIASRDPVSGTAYLLSLVIFSGMPLLVSRGQGPNNSFKPKPLRGSA